jgi:hypothetical protein
MLPAMDNRDHERPVVTRRGLLGALLALPALGAAKVTGQALGSAAGVVRPVARGRSGDRCAQCGATGHTMLAAACPAAPRVVA